METERNLLRDKLSRLEKQELELIEAVSLKGWLFLLRIGGICRSSSTISA